MKTVWKHIVCMFGHIVWLIDKGVDVIFEYFVYSLVHDMVFVMAVLPVVASTVFVTRNQSYMSLLIFVATVCVCKPLIIAAAKAMISIENHMPWNIKKK